MLYPRTGTAPVQVDAYVNASPGDEDADLLIDHKYVAKVEIDMSDGSVWVDITSLYHDVWMQSPIGGITTDVMYHHTYTEPGEYLVRARATYWDGAVIYTEMLQPPSYYHVHVLPPEGDGAAASVVAGINTYED